MTNVVAKLPGRGAKRGRLVLDETVAELVGTPFRKEDYGIVFPRNSALRKQVSVALLGLREDGTYQKLYDKWFTSK